LRSGESSPRSEHYALGPSLGQCCGGAVSLRYAVLDAAELARWPAAAPLFHLQLHGAGHVGRAIAALLARFEVVVDWIDERDAEFPALLGSQQPWHAHIRRPRVDAVADVVRHAPAGAHILVMETHNDQTQVINEAVSH